MVKINYIIFFELLVIILTLLAGPLKAHGGTSAKNLCKETHNILKQFNDIIGPRPYPMGNYLIEKWESHKDLAKVLWNQMGVSLSIKKVEVCLKPFQNLDYSSLKLALNEKYKEVSLKKIYEINPSKFNQLKSAHSKAIFDFTLIVFNGRESESKKVKEFINERAAAYAPHSHTIFKDTAKMNFDDWNAIFLHELAHRLDDIEPSIEMVNDKKNFNQMMVIIEFYEKQNTIPDQEQLKFIQSMLWNGLNIGFIAEYRAWLFVVDYLSSGRGYKLGPQTEWLRPFIEEKDKVLQKAKLFQFLDARFIDTNPSIPWMRSNLIKEELRKLRETLRSKYTF